MIRTTPKTIRDYWCRPEGGTKPVARHGAGAKSFHRMMQAACRQHRQSPRREGRNLTIQDYRRLAAPPNRQVSLPPPTASAPASSPARAIAPAGSLTTVPQPVESSVNAEKSALRRQIECAVQNAAREYGLPAELLRSVIRHESNYNPQALSPAGAQGLMQLMPATARELGVSDPFDIQQNIDGGSRYLKQMLDHFDGDLRKALAAYNAGPGTVRQYGDVPPYPETRNYVRKVMSAAGLVA